MTDLPKSYDPKKITIAVLGGHSALDICEGAKKHGFKTLVIAQKGREKTYEKYYKSRGKGKAMQGCVDEVLVLDKFADITKQDVQKKLLAKNAIVIMSRYFWVYCDFNEIEKNFKVPIYGSRSLLRLEERDQPKNQYWLLKEAGIRTPKIFNSPADIDGPVIVKVNEADRSYERAFFVATSPQDYEKKAKALIASKTIHKESLKGAVIEEFIIGAQVNLNFFYSPIRKELELMGTDARRQTSLDGFLRLDAETQMELLRSGVRPSMVETGHFSVTTKESLLEKIFEAGEKFVTATQKHFKPGITGPFALQGAVAAEKGKEEFVIFDVSFRMPGSPGTRFTPYTSYLWGQPMGYGERIAMELKEAIAKKSLAKIIT